MEDKMQQNNIVDRFADIRILRYEIPCFEQLSLQRKKFLYYLSEAALCGRDILWAQNGESNLLIRKTLEVVYLDKQAKGETDERLTLYLKCIWFANGIHHHYSNDKFEPGFSKADLQQWLKDVPKERFEAYTGVSASEALRRIERDIFDMSYRTKKVCLDDGIDLVKSSSVNFYENVTQEEVEKLYSADGRNALNSKVVKNANGEVEETVWKKGGMYSAAIERVCHWLGKALEVADNDQQRKVIEKLLKYYETGELTDFDEYNKLWVAEKSSPIDFINGFIEVYSDPLGLKGSWESIVELVDFEASERIKLISDNAQWFEDHSPIDEKFRKEQVTGVSMNVVNAVMLGGDCYPATPIGVNLPNADWIREEYGSKSISLSNITHAYHEASKESGVLTEFAASEREVALQEKYGALSDDLHTQLHECLGHGSGRMKPGVTLDDLKAYGSTIEEARADLFALYFMADEKMVELGIVPSKDVAWTHYDAYLRNGLLVQLARIAEGKNIEESHMRNRQLVCKWVLERAQGTKLVKLNDKHYVETTDYDELRRLFGELLREVQRIKSEGDLASARELVENYGVQTDPIIHKEVRQRYSSLNVAPFSGFVNPKMTTIADGGEITDIKVEYTESYVEQMLRYSEQYNTL